MSHADPSTPFATAMRKVNPHLRADASRAYASALLDDARRERLDPTLVMAVVTVESHWNVRARSYAGARGLGQLMPETAHRLGVNPDSGRSNILGLTLYLHRLLQLFHEARQPIAEAIAGYNAGPLAVKHYGGVPPYSETQHYVVKVLATWKAFRARLPHDLTVLAIAHELDAATAESHKQVVYWDAN